MKTLTESEIVGSVRMYARQELRSVMIWTDSAADSLTVTRFKSHNAIAIDAIERALTTSGIKADRIRRYIGTFGTRSAGLNCLAVRYQPRNTIGHLNRIIRQGWRELRINTWKREEPYDWAIVTTWKRTTGRARIYDGR